MADTANNGWVSLPKEQWDANRPPKTDDGWVSVPKEDWHKHLPEKAIADTKLMAGADEVREPPQGQLDEFGVPALSGQPAPFKPAPAPKPAPVVAKAVQPKPQSAPGQQNLSGVQAQNRAKVAQGAKGALDTLKQASADLEYGKPADSIYGEANRIAADVVGAPIAAARQVINPIVDSFIGWGDAQQANLNNAKLAQAQKFEAMAQANPAMGAVANQIKAQVAEDQKALPAKNMLLRQALSWMTGDPADQLNNMSDAEKSAAVNYLEDKFGIKGAAAIQSVTTATSGVVPFILVGARARAVQAVEEAVPAVQAAGTRLAKVAGLMWTLTKAAARGGAENAGIGAAERAAHGEEAFNPAGIAQDATVGAALAGGTGAAALGAGLAAEGVAATKAKLFPKLADAINNLRMERAGMSSNVGYATREGLSGLAQDIQEHPSPEIARLRDPNFKPTQAIYGPLKDGSTGFTLAEANADGSVRHSEVKSEDLSLVGKILKEKGVKVVGPSTDYMLHHVDELQNMVAEAKKAAKAGASRKTTPRPFDPDATNVARTKTPESFALHENEGALQVTPERKEAQLGNLQPGDSVNVAYFDKPASGQYIKSFTNGDVQVRLTDGTKLRVGRSAISAAEDFVGSVDKTLPESADEIFAHPRVQQYLWENNHVTADGIARSSGVSKAEAIRAINALETAGFIEHKNNGVYEFNPKGAAQEGLVGDYVRGQIKQGGMPEPMSGGGHEFVYTGRTVGPDAEYGRVTGFGPNDTVRVTVKEAANGKPAEHVFVPRKTATPISIAKDRGFTIPPSMAQPATPDGIPPHIAAEWEIAKQQADKLRNMKPGLVDKTLDKMYNYFSTPFAGKTAAEQIAKLRILGARNMNNVKAYLQRLEDVQGLKRSVHEFMADLEKVAETRMLWDELEKKYPGVAEQYKISVMNPIAAHANENEAKAMDLGAVSEDSVARGIARGEMTSYMAKTWIASMLPAKEAARLAPVSLINEGAEALAKEIFKNTRQSISGLQVARELMGLINASDIKQAAADAGTPVGQALHRLMQREIQPPWLRNLLGETNSYSLRMATSLAAQDQLIANLSAWNAVVQYREPGANGTSYNPWWSPGQTEIHQVQIPNNPNLFGKAAGGYVTKSWEPLLSMVQHTADPIKMTNLITNTLKWNWTVGGGVKTAFRDFMQNMWSSAMAGGLDFSDPVRSARAFKDALQAMGAFEDNPVPSRAGGVSLAPTKAQYQSDVMREAKLVGAMTEGPHSMDLNLAKDRKVAQRLKEEISRSKDEEGILPLLKGYWEATKHLPHQAAEVRDFLDRAMRLANYISLKEKYLQAAAKSGRADANQWAAETASKQLNDLYPNPQFTSQFIRATRKSPFPLFLTYPMELARTHINLMSYLTGGGAARDASGQVAPELTGRAAETWGRLAAMGLFLTALKFGNRQIRRTAGVDDEKAQAIVDSQSPQTRGYRPAQTVWGGADEHGAYTVVDFTHWAYPLTLMRGDPHASVLSNILVNGLMTPVQGTGIETAGRAAIAAAGGPQPPEPWSPVVQPGQNALATAMNAMLPALPGAIASLYKDTQPRSINQETLTPAMIAARQVLDVSPVGPKTQANTARGLEYKAGPEMQKNIKHIAKQGFTPERKQDLIKQEVDKSRQYVNDLSKMRDISAKDQK